MCKTARRTHGTAARSVPVAEMPASEARHPRTGVHVRPRLMRVRRPLSMPFPGRSIERVLRDLATPSNYHYHYYCYCYCYYCYYDDYYYYHHYHCYCRYTQ